MTRNDDSRRPLTEDAVIELSACPFCASTNVSFYEHVYSQQFAVSCNLCGAEGPARSSHEEAGRLWNRRINV